MDNKDELLKRLLVTFRLEADEHVKAMLAGLAELSGAAPARRQEIVEVIFREAHSLKGAARAVKITPVESLCQSLENVFTALREQQLSFSMPLGELITQAVRLIEDLAAAEAEKSRERQPEVAALIRRLDGTLRSRRTGPRYGAAAVTPSAETRTPPVEQPATPVIATPPVVRVTTARLDDVMRQTEELLSPRLAIAQRAAELRAVNGLMSSWRQRATAIRPARRLVEHHVHLQSKGGRELRRLLDYLDAEELGIRTLADRVAGLARAVQDDRRSLAVTVDGLLEDVKDLQLLPCSSLFDVIARLGRELAREQGKEVDVQVQGGNVEIDRRLLDEMKDPLVHLLRNAIDHGLENPDLRVRKGKPRQGLLTLSVAPVDSGRVTMMFRDDGAGVDLDRLKAQAIERGLVSGEDAERLDADAILQFVFRSGVSTSPLITNVSGRGLGLAIVRDKIERLGGSVHIVSQAGAGTGFHIVLPVSVSTLRGVLVEAAGRRFIVPSSNIDRVVRCSTESIRSVKNRETVAIDGNTLSLLQLHAVLGLSGPDQAVSPDGHVLVAVLTNGSMRTAFRVDTVLEEMDVLVKPLGPQLQRVRNVAGASVLGTGEVVPVLNVQDLLKAPFDAPATRPAASVKPVSKRRMHVLVAEDSITSRALLKNILESAGYAVTTAVDGIDAFTLLKTGQFDLVVSDVDMPRMSGFDLIAKMRADAALGDIPAVLVTTLDSREHRERGVDVGANAYIVKSSFDQSDLLEVVRRLI